MYSGLFSQLAADSSLSQACAFSQQAWRQHHYPPGQGTLCSGLSCFWLTEKLHARAPMSRLHAPDAALLQHIAGLQALSYYPAFPPHFVPGDQELSLLARKYGTRDWQAIRRHVADAYQGDYVFYDLARMFAYASASIVRLDALPPALPCLPSLAAGSAVIGVLRYLENGRPGGHRIAYLRDRDNRHHFFDPNAGEIVATGDAEFHAWLDDFVAHADYRNFRPCATEAFLTLYTFENVIPLPGDGQHERALVKSA